MPTLELPPDRAYLAVPAAATLLLFAGLSCAAPNMGEANALELRALPPYCHPNGPGISNCGEFANHICPAMLYINRASNTTSKPDRRYYISVARDNIKYTRAKVKGPCSVAQDIDGAEARLRILEMFPK